MSVLARRVELYEFAYGATRFRYSAGARAALLASQTYAPYPIGRAAINESADPSRNALDITAPLALPLLDLYRPSGPLAPVGVKIYRLRGTTADTIWTGEIGSVEFTGKDATLHCLSPLAGMRGMGLTRNWQKACPLTLYGAGLGQCNASREAVKVSATVTQVAGRVVHAAAFAAQPNGWWNGGYLEWSDGSVLQRRWITGHTDDAVTLMTPAAPLLPTMVVTALPGCDHSLATCAAKFGNAANYGGQPGIPVTNPMGSKEVF